MTQWAFYFDPSKCIGCHACQSACDARHNIENTGIDWRRVEHVGRGEFPDYEETAVSLSCMHCEDPPCRAVCPTGAISKRGEDGVVVVDQDKCIGCHYCAWACPYGAPQFDSTGSMQKCNFCLSVEPGDGIDAPPKGSEESPEPACVETCPGGALDAGPITAMVNKASEKAATEFANRDGANVIIETDGEIGLGAPEKSAD